MHDAACSMRDIAAELVQVLDDAEDANFAALARLLFARVAMRQAYVTVAGETSSGKSTLINGMFRHQLLPVGGAPTTASVTHVMCREEDHGRYFAIFRDATQEELDRERFVALNSEPAKDLLRLQVRSRPNNEELIGLHIFDTPGYNSIVAAHGEVLDEFLPQSDAVVFVVGYRAGFGQDNQDLLARISDLSTEEGQVPVILVVNRTPTGLTEDRRIAEIVGNASDTLRQRPPVVLVASTNSNRRDGGSVALPDTNRLWSVVAATLAEPDRRRAVDRKLLVLLLALIDEAADQAEREELATGADVLEAQEQADAIEILVRQREASLAAVARATERLTLLLPGSIETATTGLHKTLAVEVTASNKWLGKADCAEWIAGHVLPYEIRAIARSIEDQISTELARLDEELQEIANTAVAELNRSVRIERSGGRFALNLAGALARRVGGAALQSLLRGMGGVGGAAAGAGNLVKMVVSRAGKLVGKTFSKELYNQIGKTFTNRMMQRINVIVTVILEVGMFIHDASTWQDDLLRQVSKGLDEWKSEVLDDVMKRQLPAIHNANENSVKDIYDDLIATEKSGASDQDCAGHLEEITERRATLVRLKSKLSSMGQGEPT